MRSPLNPGRGSGPHLAPYIFIVAMGGACKPLTANAPGDGKSSSERSATQQAGIAESSPAADSKSAAEQAARQRARAWLTLVDQGQYIESWEAAAPLFQASTTKQQWEGAAQGVRAPLGGLSKRELRAAEYKTSLPGAPAGEYIVVHYDSAFARKATAREIVTLMLADQDSWKVVGYFVE